MLQAIDLRNVFFAGGELALLLDKRTLIALARIHVHQLQAQIVALGISGNSRLKQLGSMIQTTTLHAQVDFGQQFGERVRLRCHFDNRQLS
ncbi:hypothetical protein D3C80_1532020 [compost metagenome]